MTDRWRDRFGIKGKLRIETGRRDERPSYADGPIEHSFNATPTQPGVYTFVFALIHRDGLPSQLHAVHLFVRDGQHNDNPPTITPGQYSLHWNTTVAPGQTVKVYWVPGGGHGPPNAPIGWRLSEIAFTRSTQSSNSPGIPRYDYIGGE